MANETKKILRTRCGCRYGDLGNGTVVVLSTCNPTEKSVGTIFPWGIDVMFSQIMEMIRAGQLSEGFGWMEEEERDPPKATGRVAKFGCGCRVEEIGNGRGRILYSCPKMVEMGLEVGTETSSPLRILIAGFVLIGGTVEWEREGEEEGLNEAEWPVELDQFKIV